MDQAYEAIVKSKKSALIYAATSLMMTERTAAYAIPVPETNPQQFVAVGTPEQIASLLPEAGIKPARRKDDQRPTEPLSFEDDAAPAAPAVTVSPAPRVEDDQKRIMAAARALADRSADSCNVDREDNWYIYHSELIDDARLAFAAADAVAQPIARQAQPTDRDAGLEAAAKVCDAKFAARVESGHPREASTARALAEEIRALKGKSGEGAAS